MTTKQWRGGADAVTQVATASIDTYDAASTYTLSIGEYGFDSIAAGTADDAAAALVALANASNIPYFSAVTWTNPSAADITGTANNAGAPFVAELTVTGGTGTVTDFVDDTACTGPHHADNADNYEGGVLPVTGDDLVIAGGKAILYGLDGLASVLLLSTEIRQQFSGLIGLNPTAFATSTDGLTTDAGFLEYRTTHLQLDSDTIRVGDHDGGGSPQGSQRVYLEQQSAAASRLTVIDTAASVAGSAPAVDYLADDADADVDVRYAPGGVGVASFAGTTAVVGDLAVTDSTQASSLRVGAGTTFTNYTQQGGRNKLRAAANPTAITVKGGDLTIDGEGYLIPTLQVEAGNVEDLHVNAGGAEWTTINMRGGDLSLPEVYDAGASRAFTTMNLSRGRVEAEWGSLTGTVAINPEDGVVSRFALEATSL